MSIKYGVALYIAYLLLVPYLQISIGVSLSFNFVNLLVLFIFILKHRLLDKSEIDILPIKPFILFFVLFLLLIPIQFDTPYYEQVNMFRQTFMTVIFTPLVVWNVMRLNPNSVKIFEGILLTCIVVAGIYGLLLTQTPGINPYIIMIDNIMGQDFNSDYALDEGGGRLFGRISSVFFHPMTYGLFLGLSIIFVYSLWGKWNKFFLSVVMAIIVVNLVTCGVRSVIGGVFFAFVYYVIKSKNYRLAIYTFVLLLFGLLYVGANSEMGDYLGSMLKSDGEGVQRGSSMEMRLDQLIATFHEIQDCFFQGKGYGWTDYYMREHEAHPTIYGFESLLYVILCNGGLLGVLIWYLFLKNNLMITSEIAQEKAPIINSLLVFYVSYACITGEYNYMKYYIVFYVIMLGGTFMENETVIKNEQNEDVIWEQK